jgi:hypothetical protein
LIAARIDELLKANPLCAAALRTFHGRMKRVLNFRAFIPFIAFHLSSSSPLILSIAARPARSLSNCWAHYHPLAFLEPISKLLEEDNETGELDEARKFFPANKNPALRCHCIQAKKRSTSQR